MKKILLPLFIALCLIGIVSAAVPTVTINAGANITVTGSGELNMTYLNTTVNNIALINGTPSAGTWDIYTPIYISSANINATFSNTDVFWIRLNGTTTISFTTSSAPSNVTINNITFSSWDTNTNNYNPSNANRSSLTLSTSWVRIYDSRFLYLGNATWTNPSTSYGVVFNGGGSRSIVNNNNFSHNYMGMHLASTGMNNATISNNVFYNQSYDDIYVSNTNGVSNMTIYNNTFAQTTRYGIEWLSQAAAKTWGNVIANNTFTQKTGATLGSMLIQGNLSLIDNNTVYGSGVIFSVGIVTSNTKDVMIKQNYITNTQYNVWVFGNDSNISVFNNTFVNGDMGSDIRNGDTIWFINNTIRNMTLDYDGFDVGLRIKNATNVYIWYNNFSEIATTGIVSQRNRNISIIGNWFYTIPMAQRTNYKASDYRDPQCAISLVELFESYLGSNEETDQTDGVSYIGQFNTTNIIIDDNYFDTSTSCLLRGEGMVNLTHDLSNYWYRKINTPVGLKDVMEFYISQNFNSLSSYYSGVENLNFSSAYDNDNTHPRMRLQVTKTFMFFQNLNGTFSNQTNLYNLPLNSIFYNLNGTNFTGNGDVNYTLLWGDSMYVITSNPTATSTISFVSPTPADQSHSPKNYIFVNTSYVATNFINVTYVLYDSNENIINSTTYLHNPINSTNYTGLSEGVYYFRVFWYDDAPSYATTEMRKVAVSSSAGTFVEPFDFKTIFIGYFLGNQALFPFAFVILLSLVCGYFGMSNKVFVAILIISCIMFAAYLDQPIYFLILLVAGLIIFLGISKMFNR